MKQSLTMSLKTGVLALAIAFVGFTPTANAQSNISDLQAQIAALLATVQQLQAQLHMTPSTGVPAIALTRSLSLGMTGEDVRSLQQFLNSDPATTVALSGVGSKGNETIYFGPATQAAVIKFQNKYRSEVLAPVGLTNGTGYVGPSTIAKINQLGKQTTTTTGNTGSQGNTSNNTGNQNNNSSVSGDEGDITVTRGSEHTSTLELTGDYDEIYSIQVKADDSAMTINRIDFMFDKQAWRYIDNFVLYQEGKKIAEVKATESNLSKSGNEYRLRFSNLSAIVPDDEKHTFVLEAKALNNLSSSREADTISVYVPRQGVRAIDTAKLTTQEPNSDLDVRIFDFRDAEDDGEIITTLDSDSPDSGALQVKANSNTNDTIVMIAEVKAEESDISLDEMYVKVDSSEANVSNVVRRLTLEFDGDEIAKENVVKNTGADITGRDEDGNTYVIIASNEYYVHFEDLSDIEIDENNKEKVTILAEFYKQSGRYTNGTEVTFTIRMVGGENINGEDVINGNITTGSNRVLALYSDGLSYSFVSAEASSQGKNTQTGNYTIAFDVKAFGSDIYVPLGAARQTGTSTVGTGGVEYSFVNSSDGGRYTLGSAYDSLNIKGSKENDNFMKLSEGSTYRVTLEVTLSNSGSTEGVFKAKLEALRFRVGSPTGTEYTITSGFKDFTTRSVFLKS